MNNRFLLTLFYCLILNAGFAQSGSIAGTVVDEAGQPLPGADIYLKALNRGTTADLLGRFILTNIPAGSHEIKITFVGYEPHEQVLDVRTSETIQLNISLKSGNLQLADVVVTAETEKEFNSISQVDIQLRPTNTAQDILRMVPGLFIAQHAGGGKAEQIFLRGFDIDHGTDINMEVDGLPVNMVSHAHGQGYSDLHFLIPELVSYVDFNKGPYYADKGNLTTAGYVAFQTKNDLEHNLVKIEGGRFGSFRNVAAVNLINKEGSGNQSAYIASEYYRTDGFFESKQHFNRLNLTGKYTLNLNSKQLLTIGISTFNSRWDASGQIPDRAVESGMITRYGSLDNTEGGETSRTQGYVRFVNTFDTNRFLENQFYLINYDFKLISNFTFYLNDPVNGDQITQSESRNIYGYRLRYNAQHALGNLAVSSEVGGGFRYDQVDDLHLYRTKSRKEFLGDVARGDVDETNLYGYVNETVHLTPELSLQASLRYDYFTFNYTDALTATYQQQSVSKGIVSPKLQLNYNLNRSINLYFKSGIGFHSNDTRVVVAENGNDILPKAYGADIGGTFKPSGNLLINAALWVLDLDQEFVYVGDEGIVEPSGKTRRTGLDVSVRYQVNHWLYLDTDVNLTKPRSKEDPEGENYIPLAPVFTSIGGLTFQLNNGLNGSFRYRFISDRPANEDNSVVAQGYFLADAVLKYTRKKFEISLIAENILNTEWKEAQFDTESRLYDEPEPVSEIHFTPGTPFFIKAGLSFFF